jgi:hypothetical protein
MEILMDLPHAFLMQKSYASGEAFGREAEQKEIISYIETHHPQIRWLAELIRHGEHNDG